MRFWTLYAVFASGFNALAFVAGLEDPTTIHRDVAIIGGGASGAYSAVRLREDFGLKVILIEKDSILVRDDEISNRGY